MRGKWGGENERGRGGRVLRRVGEIGSWRYKGVRGNGREGKCDKESGRGRIEERRD